MTLQQMESAPDTVVIEACRREGRALVTLDLDFANPLDYRPSEYTGIAVLRCPRKLRRRICSKPSKRLPRDWSKTRSPANYGSSRKDASAFISRMMSHETPATVGEVSCNCRQPNKNAGEGTRTHTPCGLRSLSLLYYDSA